MNFKAGIQLHLKVKHIKFILYGAGKALSGSIGQPMPALRPAMPDLLLPFAPKPAFPFNLLYSLSIVSLALKPEAWRFAPVSGGKVGRKFHFMTKIIVTIQSNV